MEREEKMTSRARSASPAAIRKLIQQVTQDFEREETSMYVARDWGGGGGAFGVVGH